MRNAFLGGLRAAVLLCAVAALASCNTLQSVGLNIAAGVSSAAGKLAGPAPGQATTLANALLLADAATKGTKFAVDNVKLPQAVLVELNALNDAVHAALVDLETANTNGQALNYEAFNAALQAFNAYALAHGIGVAPASPPATTPPT